MARSSGRLNCSVYCPTFRSFTLAWKVFPSCSSPAVPAQMARYKCNWGHLIRVLRVEVHLVREPCASNDLQVLTTLCEWPLGSVILHGQRLICFKAGFHQKTRIFRQQFGLDGPGFDCCRHRANAPSQGSSKAPKHGESLCLSCMILVVALELDLPINCHDNSISRIVEIPPRPLPTSRGPHPGPRISIFASEERSAPQASLCALLQ